MGPSRKRLIGALVLAAAASGGAAASAAGAGGAPFAPVRIGAAPAYQPPPRWPLAGVGRGGTFLIDLQGGARVHLELFASRRVIVVPGGIGVAGGRTELYGNVVHAPWHAAAWTTAPGGVFHLARPGLRLRDVFAVWGQPLGSRRLLSFTGGEVVAFVNGRRRHTAPGDVELRDGDQVVLEIGGYVPPHPVFTFMPRAELLPVIFQAST